MPIASTPRTNYVYEDYTNGGRVTLRGILNFEMRLFVIIFLNKNNLVNIEIDFCLLYSMYKIILLLPVFQIIITLLQQVGVNIYYFSTLILQN